MHTSWHTSVRRVAVRFFISLCLIEGKPPLAQDRACSTEKVEPQAHLTGNLSGVQPYRNARASWKAPLCNAKPCSESGGAVRWMNLSHLLVSLISAGRLVEARSGHGLSESFSPCSRF